MGVGVGGVVNYANVSSGTASDVVAYGGVGGPYEYCSFFSVLNWFAKGEPGAWYDPSDLTTLFQDSAGTTPVTAVEQPVGLMLDKSRGLALGAELVTNGDFSNGTTGWSAQPDWTISTGVASYNKGTVLQYLQTDANISIVSGNWYKLTVNFLSVGSSAIFSIFNKSESVNYFGSYQFVYSAGVKSFYFLATTTTTGVKLYANNGGSSFSISSFSVKQIAGNHAFQGDMTTGAAAKRPMLSARVNLLTKTEDFSDAVWASTASNITVLPNYTTAPNGTLTADKIVGTLGTVSPHYVGYGGGNLTGLVIGTVYRAFIYIKAGGITTALINFYTTLATVDLAAVTISGVGSTIDPVGDGWFKCTMLHTATATSEYFVIQSGATYTGDGTNGIYIWGADLRPTNSGALLPAYQRVNTASDYDTVGFPLYLKANGSSSAMSTNSIDFTSTDKMTVVTGVRKLSDAFNGIVYELSASSSNNGVFSCFAPLVSLPIIAVTSNYTLTVNGSGPGAQVGIRDYTAPTINVITSALDLSGLTSLTEILPRANGVVPIKAGSATDAGTGNFGNHPLYLFARGGTILFFNGQFYGAIIRGAQSDTASVTQTENYMATKTGITF